MSNFHAVLPIDILPASFSVLSEFFPRSLCFQPLLQATSIDGFSVHHSSLIYQLHGKFFKETLLSFYDIALIF